MNDERKLFVGNLAWAVDGLDLEDIFKEFGTVESAQARAPHAASAPRRAEHARQLRSRYSSGCDAQPCGAIGRQLCPAQPPTQPQ